MLTDSPIPGVAGYGQTLDSAKLAYQNALTKIGLQRQNLMHQYGYQANFDPTTGQMTNMAVDGTNQFGGLQQMLRGFSQEDQQAKDNAIARGLHGGLAHQAETDLNYSHGLQSAQFGQNVDNAFGQTANDWYGAQQDYNNSLYEAELAAARSAIGNGDFNQGDYSGVDTSYPGSDGSTSGGNGGSGAGGSSGATTNAGARSSLASVRAQTIANAAARAKAASMKARPIKNAYTTGQKRRG